MRKLARILPIVTFWRKQKQNDELEIFLQSENEYKIFKGSHMNKWH